MPEPTFNFAFPNSQFVGRAPAGLDDASARYSIICGDPSGEHFTWNYYASGKMSVSTPSGREIPSIPLTTGISLVPSQQCLAGSAETKTQLGIFVVQAKLFVISPHGFGGVGMKFLEVDGQTLLAAPGGLALEADARGRACLECASPLTIELAGCSYNPPGGHTEMEISPFAIDPQWIESIFTK